MSEMAHQIIWKKNSSENKKNTIYASDYDYFRINSTLKKAICFFLHVCGVLYKGTMNSLVQEQGFIYDIVQFWSTEV